MFCCGQSRKSSQSHLAQNNNLFEKATTAIIECIFQISNYRFECLPCNNACAWRFSRLSLFAIQSFTTEQRKLIDESSFLFFKRLREDKILQFQESVSSQEEESHEGNEADYISRQIDEAKSTHDEIETAVELCRLNILKLIEGEEYILPGNKISEILLTRRLLGRVNLSVT